ncbi:MAG: hypothetical protein AAFQ81_07615 [Pseudomonadota bacterium]
MILAAGTIGTRNWRYDRKPYAVAAAMVAAGAFAGAAMAQTLDCGEHAAMRDVAEPWYENTTAFANGAIRLAVSDAGAPACCSLRLVVLYPDPTSPDGGRACAVIEDRPGEGYFSIDVREADGRYDAETGLSVSVPARRAAADGSGVGPRADIAFTVNQQTGTLTRP